MTKYSTVSEKLKTEINSNKNNNWAFATHLHQFGSDFKKNHYYSSFEEFQTKSIINLNLFESPVFQYAMNFDWDVPFPPPLKTKFKFIDLFAGIGGFRIPLQELGGKCVFSSEIDNMAKTTYEANYGEYPFGDFREFTNHSISDEELDELIPDHDLIAGGFPCHPFSLAGVSARNL